MRIGNNKLNYFDYISSFQNKDCTAALLRIAPKINMSKIFSIIESIESLSDLQKQFYKTILLYRKERILDFSIQKLQEIEKSNFAKEALI